MLSNIFNWLFSKTKLGKLIDGHKTAIGFWILVLRQLIPILAIAVSVFPQVGAVTQAYAALIALDQAVGPLLEQFGIGVMAVGVGHKAIKEQESKKPATPTVVDSQDS